LRRGPGARGDDHRRARRGPRQEGVPQGPVRRLEPRAPQARQAVPRPGEPPQPGEDLRPVRAEPNLLRSLDYSVLQQCMHCGLCLPTCPTFLETSRERHSPRGRISLMRAIADGELETTRAFADEMDYCLGCLACTTACPAGVDYGTLFESARAEADRSGVLAGPARSLVRLVSLRFLLFRPWALRLAGRLLWLYGASGIQALLRKSGFFSLLPRRVGELERQAIP